MLSTRSSSLPNLGKSPSISKSVIMPVFSSRMGFTLAYLIAESESAMQLMPAMPNAISLCTSVSCSDIWLFS